MPADSTLPIQHCSTADAVTPALFSAPVMAVAPSFAAGTEASEPLKPPMGVRAAATMQTSRGDAELLLQSRRTDHRIKYYVLGLEAKGCPKFLAAASQPPPLLRLAFASSHRSPRIVLENHFREVVQRVAHRVHPSGPNRQRSVGRVAAAGEPSAPKREPSVMPDGVK